MDIILKYRIHILVFLAILETVITLFTFLEPLENEELFNLLESLIIILILLFTYYFSYRFKELQYMHDINNLILKHTSEKQMFYDSQSGNVLMSKSVAEALGFDNKKNIDVSDLSQLFNNEWPKIEPYFEDNIRAFEISGKIISTYNKTPRLFAYKIQSINSNAKKISGCSILLKDISLEQKNDDELIAILNKYRQMSFTTCR
jgi:hypothetical protein